MNSGKEIREYEWQIEKINTILKTVERIKSM